MNLPKLEDMLGVGDIFRVIDKGKDDYGKAFYVYALDKGRPSFKVIELGGDYSIRGSTLEGDIEGVDYQKINTIKPPEGDSQIVDYAKLLSVNLENLEQAADYPINVVGMHLRSPDKYINSAYRLSISSSESENTLVLDMYYKLDEEGKVSIEFNPQSLKDYLHQTGGTEVDMFMSDRGCRESGLINIHSKDDKFNSIKEAYERVQEIFKDIKECYKVTVEEKSPTS